MSEQSDLQFVPEDFGLKPTPEAQNRAYVRRLEADKAAALKEADEAKAKLAVLERQQAFADAGIPQGGMAEYFRKGYEGDLTSDAIKAAATAAGLATAPPTGQAAVRAQALAGTAQAQQLAAGAQTAPPDTLGTDLATIRQQARATRNPAAFSALRTQVAQRMVSEGVEVQQQQAANRRGA